jgi:hypothetical protein
MELRSSGKYVILIARSSRKIRLIALAPGFK